MTDIDRPTRGFSPRAERMRLEFGAHRFRTVFLAGVAGIALMAAETDANAEPVAWTSGGGGSKLWSNGANWQPGAVPTATSAVTIDSGTAKNTTVRTTIDSDAVAASLDIGHAGAAAKATLVQTQGSGTLTVDTLHLLSGGWLQILDTTLASGAAGLTAGTVSIDDKAILDINTGNAVATTGLTLAGTAQGGGKLVATSIVQTDGRMGVGQVETDTYDLSGGKTATTTIAFATSFLLSGTGAVSDVGATLIGGAGSTMTQSDGIMGGTVSGIDSYTQTGGPMGAFVDDFINGTVTTATYTLSGGSITGAVDFSTLFALSGTGTVDASALLTGRDGSVMTQSGGTMDGTVTGADSYTHSGGALGGKVTTGTYILTDAAATSAGGTITASESFALAVDGGTATVAAQLSGAAGVTKSGAGTVVLVNQSNNFSGAVAVAAGTLEVLDDALPDAAAVTVADGATLSMNTANDTAFTGSIEGAGDLVKTGTATLTLDGPVSVGGLYVDAGTLEAIDGALTGAAAVTVADGATLAMNTANDTVFLGTMDGSGGELVKTGSGSLTLAGDVMLGGLNVNEGLLQVGTGVSENLVSFDYAVVDEGATLYVATGATLTIRIPNNLTNNGTFINDGTVNDDLDNTGPFTNNGVYNAKVLSNTGSIANNAPGVWTGDIITNDGTISNMTGAKWVGDIQSNDHVIKNSGTWTGFIETNESQISNEAGGRWTGDVLSNNNTILNLVGGTWTGDVVANGGGSNANAEILNRGTWTGAIKSNDDIIYNDGGIWIGDVEGNDDLIANFVDGKWTGDVVANAGYLANDGAWTGDVLGNSSTVTNTSKATWTGDVAGNGSALDNTGTWKGDVLANGGQITNGGTWTGDILGNQRQIANADGGTWTGDVVGNGNIIYNRAGGTWTGDILGNGGDGEFTPIFNSGTWTGDIKGNESAVYNDDGGTWDGDVAANDGFVTNLDGGVWAGDVTTNEGQISNEDGGVWTGDVRGNNNAIFNEAGGAWTGDVVANGGDNDLAALINRGAWDGDVLGNTGYVLNEDGTWTGDVAANSGQVSNTGTWTGDIVSNDSQIGNEGGIWNGDILGNDVAIFNAAGGTWSGTVVANGGGSDVLAQVINRGDWTGDVETNAGTIFNEAGGIWDGDVLANAGRIVTSSVWTGDFISAGRVLAEGEINGAFTNSGELRVTGTLTGITTLDNTGVISMVGNGATQLLTVAAVDFSDVSFYDLDIDAGGDTDEIVADAATLNGGTVRVTASTTGGAYDPSTTYTILSATTLTGEFDGVTTNLAYFDPRLAYDDNAVLLTLMRNDVGFGDAGTTANQRAAGTGAESLGTGNAIYDAVLWLGEDETGSAFDSLSGEAYASFEAVSIQSAAVIADIITGRLDRAFATSEGRPLPVSAYADAADPAAVAARNNWIWATLYGASASLPGDGNTADADSTMGGIAGGIDGLLGDWHVGVMAHAGRTRAEVDDRATSGESTDYGFGVYGGRAWGATALALGATYTRHDWDVSRTVGFPGYSDALSADYSSGTAQAFGKISHAFDLGGISLIPYASLAYVNQAADRFSETDGAAALEGRSDSVNALFTTLGLGGERSTVIGGRLLTAKASLGWRHATADTVGATRSLAGGDSFYVVGTSVPSDMAVIDAGLELDISPASTLSLGYDGQLGRDGAQSHSAKGSWTMRF